MGIDLSSLVVICCDVKNRDVENGDVENRAIVLIRGR